MHWRLFCLPTFSQMLQFQVKRLNSFFKAHMDIIDPLSVSEYSPLLSLLEHSVKGVTVKPATWDIQFIKKNFFMHCSFFFTGS